MLFICSLLHQNQSWTFILPLRLLNKLPSLKIPVRTLLGRTFQTILSFIHLNAGKQLLRQHLLCPTYLYHSTIQLKNVSVHFVTITLKILTKLLLKEHTSGRAPTEPSLSYHIAATSCERKTSQGLPQPATPSFWAGTRLVSPFTIYTCRDRLNRI